MKEISMYALDTQGSLQAIRVNPDGALLSALDVSDITLDADIDSFAGQAVALNSGVASAGTLRVVHVTDVGLSTVALTIPDATATYAPTNSDSTAYVTTQTVKASAGVVYSLTGYNSSTSAVFVQIHNAASTPAEAAAPVVTMTVPASSNFSWEPGQKFGKYFSTGIVVLGSDLGPTKQKISDASLWFNISYS